METDSRQTSGSDAGAFPGFEDLKKLIEKFQLPSVDIDALIDWQRKDMEALTEANRQAPEGLKALVERRNEILRETLTEWKRRRATMRGRSCRSACRRIWQACRSCCNRSSGVRRGSASTRANECT